MAITDSHNDPNHIVRSFVSLNAPTTEGMSYQTADGRVWRETWNTNCGTVQTLGRVRDNRVEPLR